VSADGVSQDSDSVSLQVFSTGEVLTGWSSYTFTESFLTPSDSWTFTIEGEDAVAAFTPKLLAGTKVSLLINGRIQTTGLIDKADPHTTKGGGTALVVDGRDMMSQAVDGCISPNLVLRPGMTLMDLLVAVFTPYGFKIFSRTNLTNRAIITGNDGKKTFTRTELVPAPVALVTLGPTGQRVSVFVPTVGGQSQMVSVGSEYDPTRPAFLTSLPIANAKPHFGEGAFEFVARILKRFNLWIWPNSLGDTIIVGAPDFGQPATFALTHSATTGQNDTLTSSFPRDRMNQPSAIVAVGHGGGGNYAATTLKCAMVNELTGLDAGGNVKFDVLQAIADGLVGSSGVDPFKFILKFRVQLAPFAPDFANCAARVVYREDDEAHTPGQLEGFVRTEMAKFQHKAAIYHCTVPGHTQGGNVWAIDTMCIVNDERAGCQERMWLLTRTFAKSKGAGTVSTLEFCRPYTIEYGANSAAYNDISPRA